jgi:molybdopterin-guanine dinucleotide biosynthesis protein A
LAPKLAEILRRSSPGFAGLTASLRVLELEGSAEAFFNVNTPADLAQL